MQILASGIYGIPHILRLNSTHPPCLLHLRSLKLFNRASRERKEKRRRSKPALEAEASKPSQLAFDASPSFAPCYRTQPVSQSA
jgi:hypothetical protein